MDGFGVHAFSMTNASGERVWVKWHLKTKQGIKSLETTEAERIAGEDPDYAQRDLFNAIAHSEFPKWDVCIQVMTESDRVSWEKRTGWNAFDATKTWPYKDFPLESVGVLELNRNVDNYHAEVEQAALSPANVVPGLGYSPDKLLQGRIFAYHDAQLYRIGVNHQHLPINRARCPIMNQQRDGAMTILNPGAATVIGTVDAQGTKPSGLGNGEPGLCLEGAAARYDARGTEDDYSQAGDLFRLFSDADKEKLFENIACSLGKASAEIQQRQLAHFDKADPAYGSGVRRALRSVKSRP